MGSEAVTDLSSLLSRLSSSREGSRELDIEIDHAIKKPEDWDWRFEPPKYTGSLDAALSLVPEGLSWEVRQIVTFECDAIVYGHDIHQSAEAATPALALVIAALRAREASK